MKIVLPIHPIYSKQIFDGIKKYEFRTKIPKQKIETILVYETAPTKKIVGELVVEEILAMNKEDLWKEVKEHGCISKEDLFNYFQNQEIAYAYKIGKTKRYSTYKELKDFNIDFAPQSFVYLKEKEE